MRIINNQQEFNQLCSDLLKEPSVFLDTEFDRRRTYYATLSLIQIATQNQRIIIDALSGIDLQLFGTVLSDNNVCKILHAPDQDFDIFYHLFGKLPKNIFDTQIAAGVIGLEEGIGYARLCKTLLNINIDKTLQKANWLERPLSNKSLNYAIKDVEYLIPLYRELSNSLNSRDLWDAYNARSKKLVQPETYKLNLDRMMKKANILDRSEDLKTRFKNLALFREECAQILNIPRGRCASEENLVTLSEQLPITDRELSKLHMDRLHITKRKFRHKLLALCLGMHEQD